jgi:hypothetical protein
MYIHAHEHAQSDPTSTSTASLFTSSPLLLSHSPLLCLLFLHLYTPVSFHTPPSTHLSRVLPPFLAPLSPSLLLTFPPPILPLPSFSSTPRCLSCKKMLKHLTHCYEPASCVICAPRTLPRSFQELHKLNNRYCSESDRRWYCALCAVWCVLCAVWCVLSAVW